MMPDGEMGSPIAGMLETLSDMPDDELDESTSIFASEDDDGATEVASDPNAEAAAFAAAFAAA